jgi:hypothetical protein
LDRRTEAAAGSGSGGAAPTAVTSRGAVDEELDDLTLDEELRGADDEDGDAAAEGPGQSNAAPTGVMAPPKRSSTRKPPTRKPAGAQSGNGRAAGNGSGSAKKEPAEPDGGQDEKTSAAQATVELPSVVGTAGAKKPSADSSRESAKDSASESVPDEPKAPAGQSDKADEGGKPDEGGKADEGGKPDEPSASAATPAMPADEIWMPRTSRQSSGSAPAWTPVDASERPRGNAFEVNDAFSAPPMPSDTTFTPAPASYPSSSVGSPTTPVSPASPSKSSSNTSSFGSFAAAAASDTAKAKPESKPPARAFPRPAGKGPAGAAPTKPAKPSAKPKATVRRSTARQAHLTVSRVEPWSVMKFSFAVSVVAFIVLFVAVALLFAVLSALGVFDSLQHLVNSVTSSQGSSGYNVKKWFTASRILSYTAMLGGINIILITAISTIGSVIYNLASRLIGGVEVTLKETD